MDQRLDYIADEAVQIHGGMGYSAEMLVDRGYRDSRINRIFEGTNEINRILVVDTLLKRGQKKDIPLYEKAEEAYKNLMNLPAKESIPEGYYERKKYHIDNLKSLILANIHAVSEKFSRKLVFEQEILNGLSESDNTETAFKNLSNSSPSAKQFATSLPAFAATLQASKTATSRMSLYKPIDSDPFIASIF